MLLTGLGLALASLIFGGCVVAGALYLSGIETIDWTVGLAGKILFAGFLAAVVTPVGLRRLVGARSLQG